MILLLSSDPFERAMHESIGWADWSVRRMYLISGAAVVTTDFLKSFLELPPRQVPGSFSMDAIMAQLEATRAARQ